MTISTVVYGTRVSFNGMTGTVIDPDEPGRGQPYPGYRPDGDDYVWIYLDAKYHSRTDNYIADGVGPKHGLWIRTDDPGFEILPNASLDVSAHPFKTGDLARITYTDGGVETIKTGVITVEGGSVRLGEKDHNGNYQWIDWSMMQTMEVLN